MPADATKIVVGAGGKIFGGTGTLPTDATTAPTTNWTDLGHITEDGVTEATENTSTDIKNWYGAVVRTITSEHAYKLSFSFMETNAAVLKAYYGDATATDSAWTVAARQGLRQKWVIDAVDGAKTRRLVIPDGQVSEVGNITSATSDAIVYPVTITCYPDGTGKEAYGYVG